MWYRTEARTNIPAEWERVAALGVTGRTVDAACRSCELLAGALLPSEAEVRRLGSLQGRLEGELQAQRACAADWEERLRQAE